MEFNKVVHGIARYINKEIFPNMNNWQEALARIAVSRFLNNVDAVKETILNNGFIKTFAFFDENEQLDVDGLINDLKSAIREKGFIEFELPLFGKFKFTESDVDVLHSYVRGV